MLHPRDYFVTTTLYLVQNKTPEKELNKMEVSNLSDVEFKTLVIRMFEELIGYFNSIKKTQAEMKVTF